MLDHRLIEYDFIRTTLYEPRAFESAMAAGVPAVFSSQNAVWAVAPLIASRRADFRRVFCVGEKTASALIQLGIHPQCSAPNAQLLAEAILEIQGFTALNYFCGRVHRPELPQRLTAAKRHLFKVVVYETAYRVHRVREAFEIALFYSPRAAEGFLQCNILNADQTAVAIGPTTAAYLRSFHPNTVVASAPTVERVLCKALEILR